MFRNIVIFSTLIVVASLVPLGFTRAASTTIFSQEPTATPSLSVTALPPKVVGSNVIFTVTVSNDHPYFIPAVSLVAQRVEQQYVHAANTNSSVTVNGKPLGGSYISIPVQASNYDSVLTLAAHSKQTATVSLPLLAGVNDAGFQVFAINRGGESLGMSKMLSLPVGQTMPAPASITIQDAKLITAKGVVDTSGFGLVTAANSLPSLKLTLHNSTLTDQQVTPEVIYYKQNQDLVGAELSRQKFDAVTLNGQATKDFTYSVSGTFAPQKYQARVLLLTKDGKELLPEKSVQLVVSGQSAKINNLVITASGSGAVAGDVFVTGPADRKTVLKGSLHTWLTDNSHPEKIFAQSTSPLPDFSKANITAIPFAITYSILFGNSDVRLHLEILNEKGAILDTFSVPTVLVGQYTFLQYISILLGIILLGVMLFLLLQRLRGTKLQWGNARRPATVVLMIGIVLFPLISSPKLASAALIQQITPISQDFTNFEINNTGVGYGASTLGSAAGADDYAAVASTLGNKKGGVALSSIEVAPGFGSQWSFAKDVVDYNSYTRVPCRTSTAAWQLVDPYQTADGITHTWKYIQTPDVCGTSYGKGFGYYQNLNPVISETSRSYNIDLYCLGYSSQYNASCIGVTPGFPSLAQFVNSDPYCENGPRNQSSTSCAGTNFNQPKIISNLANRTPIGPLCDVTRTYKRKIGNTQNTVDVTFNAVPTFTPSWYTSSCYVNIPNVKIYNADATDRPLPLYGVQVSSDGTHHQFFRDVAFPAISVDPVSQDLMACAEDPAFPGKENIDTSYDPSIGGPNGYLVSKGIPYPNIQAYPANETDLAKITGYIVTEAKNSGSLRVYVALCLKPKLDGSPGTAKIGFNAQSNEYKETSNNYAANDVNGYVRKLANSWTFMHGNQYATRFLDQGFYTWGDHLSDGKAADRACLSEDSGAGTDGDCYNSLYYSDRMDSDFFFNPSWSEANPNTTGSASNDWVSYTQPLFSTCSQFVISAAESPYAGSSNPGLNRPPNLGSNSTVPFASVANFSSKYGGTCNNIQPISNSSGPTVTLSAASPVAAGSTILFKTTATKNSSLTIKQAGSVILSVTPVSGANSSYPAPAPGTYLYIAEACNAAGTCVDSTPVSVTTTASPSVVPVVNLIAPIAVYAGSPAPLSWTNNSSATYITLSGGEFTGSVKHYPVNSGITTQPLTVDTTYSATPFTAAGVAGAVASKTVKVVANSLVPQPRLDLTGPTADQTAGTSFALKLVVNNYPSATNSYITVDPGGTVAGCSWAAGNGGQCTDVQNPTAVTTYKYIGYACSASACLASNSISVKVTAGSGVGDTFGYSISSDKASIPSSGGQYVLTASPNSGSPTADRVSIQCSSLDSSHPVLLNAGSGIASYTCTAPANYNATPQDITASATAKKSGSPDSVPSVKVKYAPVEQTLPISVSTALSHFCLGD